MMAGHPGNNFALSTLQRMSEIARQSQFESSNKARWNNSSGNKTSSNIPEVFRCVWCQERYNSLSELTQHLREANHAASMAAATTPPQNPANNNNNLPSSSASSSPLDSLSMSSSEEKNQGMMGINKKSQQQQSAASPPRKLVRGQARSALDMQRESQKNL